MKKIILASGFVIALLFPHNTFADESVTIKTLKAVFTSGPITYETLTQIPGVTQINGTSGNPAEMIAGLYKFAIGIASILAVIMIMYAGFQYMTTEAFTGKSAAKDRITYSFVGLLLLLSSYIILNTINKDLVSFKIGIAVPDASTISMINSGMAELNNMVAKAQENSKQNANLSAQIAQKSASYADTIKNASTENDSLTKQITDLKKQGKTDDSPEVKVLKNQIDGNNTLISQAKTGQNQLLETDTKQLITNRVMDIRSSSVALAMNGVNNNDKYNNTEWTLPSTRKELMVEKAQQVTKAAEMTNGNTLAQIDSYLESVNKSDLTQEKKDSINKEIGESKAYVEWVNTEVLKKTVEPLQGGLDAKGTTLLWDNMQTKDGIEKNLDPYITGIQKNFDDKINQYKASGRTDLATAAENDKKTYTAMILSQVADVMKENSVDEADMKAKCTTYANTYSSLKNLPCSN